MPFNHCFPLLYAGISSPRASLNNDFFSSVKLNTVRQLSCPGEYNVCPVPESWRPFSAGSTVPLDRDPVVKTKAKFTQIGLI